MTSGANSPILCQRRLAGELRRLRESSGRTISETAEHLGCASSKISRIENSVSRVHWRDVRDMVRFYGGSPAEFDQLVGLARQARQRGWWHPYSAALGEGYAVHIGLEAEAVRSRTFEVAVIPGLLQTRDYAVGVMAASGVDRELGRDRVEVRIRRQEVLSRREPPLHLHAIVDEAALRRKFAPGPVMRAQLAHLIDSASRPNVTVQVLPFAAGGHPATTGPFVILDLPGDHPPAVFTERLHDDVCLDARADVDAFGTVFDRLAAIALDPAASADFLAGEVSE